MVVALWQQFEFYYAFYGNIIYAGYNVLQYSAFNMKFLFILTLVIPVDLSTKPYYSQFFKRSLFFKILPIYVVNRI